MTRLDKSFWNLAQTTAWVVYREKKLVDKLANPAAESYTALGQYQTMWPDHRRRHDNLATLHDALLTANFEQTDTMMMRRTRARKSLQIRSPTLLSTPKRVCPHRKKYYLGDE